MNVQKMNGQKAENQDSYKSLLLLDEIAKGEPLSQRDLSKRLHIALGLVNSYVKNLIAKGYAFTSDTDTEVATTSASSRARWRRFSVC